MNTLIKMLIGVSILLTLTCPTRALAQTENKSQLFFECTITNHFRADYFNYYVIDGWRNVYGPYNFYFDAQDAAEQLLWRGDCDQIIDLSW